MPDLNLDQAIEHLRRMRGAADPSRDWYRMEAKADKRKAKIRIYDIIGWETAAGSFGRDLDALDVDEIDLRLNSPGGLAEDGVAIYNALRDHPATVVVTVDGVAASAASAIAMAGDRIRMARGSTMMIHDVGGGVFGNEAAMLKAAEAVSKLSESYADIYAARAGGTAAEWREAMREETWYTAAEAVDAGLADELVDDSATSEAKANWDLKTFAYAYAGRDAAPPPKIARRTPPPPPEAPAPTGASPSPATDAGGTTETTATAAEEKGAGLMDPAKIREGLGLAPDAPDDEVRTALVAAGLATAPPAPPAPTATVDQQDQRVAANAAKVGLITIDPAQLEQYQQGMIRAAALAKRLEAQDRDNAIDAAVKAGKFPPARRAHYERAWDADPEGTRELIASLAPGLVPVTAMGYSTDADDAIFDAEFARLFPAVKEG